MPWSLFPTKRPTISKTTLDLLLILFGMTLFYYEPFLNPSRISYGGDALSLFLPAMHHYRQAMYHGIFALWNPYTWFGSPFLAAYQSAVFYPPMLISLFFKSAATAVNFHVFMSFVWLAFGAYMFGVRALMLERIPSILMAMALGCSAFVGGHTDHINQLAAISWIPWILSEALIILLTPQLRSVVLLALCLGIQVLAGHPQYVVYTLTYLLGLVAIYSVYLYHRRKIEDPPAGLGILLLGIAIVIGLGIGSVQLLPSAELSKLSVRQIDEPGRMMAYSYPPAHIVTMVYPTAYGNPVTGLHHLNKVYNEEAKEKEYVPYEYNYSEFCNYLGIITVALALLAIITLAKEFVVRCFLILALLSLLVSFGGNVGGGIIYQIALMWFPGAEHMRVPARFMIFFNLSVVVLAAVGFNQVVYYLTERHRIRSTTLAPLRFLIIALVLLDLFWFSKNQPFRYHGSTDILEQKGAVWSFLQNEAGPFRVFRQLVEVPYTGDENRILENVTNKKYSTLLQLQRFQPNLNMLGGIAVDMGYEEGLLPTMSYLNFVNKYRRNLRPQPSDTLRYPTPDTLMMGLLNIKYVAADVPVMGDALVPKIIQGEMASFEQVRRFQLFENKDVFSKFIWGQALRKAIDPAQLESNVDKKNPVFPPSDAQIFEYRKGNSIEILRKTLSEAALSDFSPLVGSPNGYALQKDVSQSGELVMLEAAYPGWVCKWDGGKAEMKRINPMMMSCKVPKGIKKMEVRYEPNSFRLGLFLTCLFTMIVTALGAYGSINRIRYFRERIHRA